MACPRHVLVVEDDQDVRETLAELLIDEGYTVHTAPDGEQAMAKLRDAQPCIMLLDLMMPVMNGWQVLEAVGADATLKVVPIAVISAAARTVPEGAIALLPKPVNVTKLLDLIRTHCAP